jgi:solute:Na+ symporter, SSS family
MRWLDWVVVAVYLAYIVFDGVRFSRRKEGLEGYLLAQRSLPWWAVGLSVMATQLSAITLVGTTGQAFDDGMRFIQFYFGLPLAMIILCMTVVPFFYRAKVFTAYEYLERRFDARTRTMTSFLFLMSRGLSCGVIIAAPSVILSIVLGWDRLATILAMGATTTIYTMLGGVRAVTWTDVKQMAVIFAGLAAVFIVIMSSMPEGIGISEALHVAGAAGRLTTVDTTFDPKETYTLWSGLFGGLFLMLSYFGCDQSQVQRFLTARSVSEGRTSLLMSAFVKIPMQFLILLIGVLVFVFYNFLGGAESPPLIFDKAERAKLAASSYGPELERLETRYRGLHEQRRTAAQTAARLGADGASESTDPADVDAFRQYRAAQDSVTELRRSARDLVRRNNGAASYSDANYVFPTFITTYLPIGLVGLMIAAIFAAAMSSISAELNALATASTIDFYRRHVRPDASDEQYVRFSRIATAFWGVFACVAAYYAANLGSLIEVVNRFGSFFYGSLLGVFVLAIGTRRATSRGAFWGLLAGMMSVALINYYPEVAGTWKSVTGSDALLVHVEALKISFLWFNLIGCAVVVAVGMLISVFDRTPRAPAPAP